MVSDPVVDSIVAHLARVARGEVPEAACAAAKTFIADTLGVGIAGAQAPWRRDVLDMARGASQEATVWGSGERLPLAAAAMVNAFQVHSQEFDPVHEGAVVHPMAAVLACALGWAEREGGISGDQLIRTVIAGVGGVLVAVAGSVVVWLVTSVTGAAGCAVAVVGAEPAVVGVAEATGVAGATLGFLASLVRRPGCEPVMA